MEGGSKWFTCSSQPAESTSTADVYGGPNVCSEASGATSEAPEDAREQIQSTSLIEVLLKLDDGCVELCQVRADDRCKDVAARFVRDHSLKSWFEQPLKAYLMKAEAEAEKFPVRLEADLMEIRKQYSSKALP